MTEDSSRAAWLAQARSYLRHADPVLERLINDRPDFDPGYLFSAAFEPAEAPPVGRHRNG